MRSPCMPIFFGFTTTNDGFQPLSPCLKDFTPDKFIGFGKPMTAFGMSDNDPFHSEISQHRR